jgi:vitamin B12 transporter
LGDTISAPGEYNGFFDHSAGRQIVSAFVDHQYSIGKFALGAGLLLNYSNAFGSGLYPGLDAGYEFSKGTSVFISVNRALRLPTYTDLYYKGPTNLGNPDLKPEESWDFEAGIKMNKPGISGSISGFYRVGYHLIDWVKSEGQTIWHSENLSRMNTTGVEAGVSLFPEKLIGRRIFVERLGFNYAWVDVSKANKNIISYYVLDFLKHKAVLSLQHHIWKNLGASWGIIFQNRAGTYTDPQTNHEEKYKPFITLDGRLYWDIKLLSFYMSVSNITNTSRRDFGAIPLPGRWLVCGLSIEL